MAHLQATLFKTKLVLNEKELFKRSRFCSCDIKPLDY